MGGAHHGLDSSLATAGKKRKAGWVGSGHTLQGRRADNTVSGQVLAPYCESLTKIRWPVAEKPLASVAVLALSRLSSIVYARTARALDALSLCLWQVV